MCLIITAFAAIFSTIVWYFKLNDRKYKMGTLSLMYWGASIMWFVDGIFAVANGEKFFDISIDDAVLGLLIVAIGLIAWIIMLLISDPKNIFSLKKQK